MATDLKRRRILAGAGSLFAASYVGSGFSRPSTLLGAGTSSGLALQEGATLPPGQTNADYPISEVMTRLSTYMSQARDRALPDEVVEQAKRHILDTMAAMVSGAELIPGRAAIALAVAEAITSTYETA